MWKTEAWRTQHSLCGQEVTSVKYHMSEITDAISKEEVTGQGPTGAWHRGEAEWTCERGSKW